MAQNYEIDIKRFNGQDYDTLLPTPASHASTHQADGSDPLTLQAGNYGALSIPTSAYQNASVSRAKLAQDALYSPIVLITSDTSITVNDIGKTYRTGGSNSGITLTLTQDVSSRLPNGAEIAFMVWVGRNGKFVFDGVKVATQGNTSPFVSPTFVIEKYGMVAIKKVLTDPNGDSWILTGPAEVVS